MPMRPSRSMCQKASTSGAPGSRAAIPITASGSLAAPSIFRSFARNSAISTRARFTGDISGVLWVVAIYSFPFVPMPSSAMSSASAADSSIFRMSSTVDWPDSCASSSSPSIKWASF